MKNIVLISFLTASLCVNFYSFVLRQEKFSIGYGYTIISRAGDVKLCYDNKIIVEDVIKVISENGVVVGDGGSRDGKYFIAIGHRVQFYSKYSDMIKDSSLKGIDVSESKYLSLL